jgi:hypothetical protein
MELVADHAPEMRVDPGAWKRLGAVKRERLVAAYEANDLATIHELVPPIDANSAIAVRSCADDGGEIPQADSWHMRDLPPDELAELRGWA